MGYLALDENGTEAAAATRDQTRERQWGRGPDHELVLDRHPQLTADGRSHS